MAATPTKKARSKKKTKKKSTARKVSSKKRVRKKVSKKKSSSRITKKPVRAAKKKRVAKKSSKIVRKKKTVRKIAAKVNGEPLIHGIPRYVPKKREKYMNVNHAKHFRKILIAWKISLAEEIDRTIHTMQDQTINHPDPNDRASQEAEISLELRSRDRERKLISKIEKTIGSLDTGDYGYCERCGIEIGIERLEARPTANQCIDCKTLDEIKEKQMI